MAVPTRRPIEIDLSGIDLEAIKLFVQEEAREMPAMAPACLPPCVTPCACTQSNFVRK